MNKEKRQMNHRRLLAILASSMALLAVAIGAAPPAQAEFGFSNADVRVTAKDETPNQPQDDPLVTQAGSHPFAVTAYYEVNYEEPEFFSWFPDEQIRDVILEQPAGLSGSVTSVPYCSTAAFLQSSLLVTGCPSDTAVGVSGTALFVPPGFFPFYLNSSIHLLKPPPGVAARFGFTVGGVSQLVDIGVKEGDDYNIVAKSPKISQVTTVYGGAVQLWGVPHDPAHDPLRGKCVFDGVIEGGFDFEGNLSGEQSCPAGDAVGVTPLLNLPTSCDGPAKFHWEADSWSNPGNWLEFDTFTPTGFTGCGKLNFEPELEARPTSDSAETGTGLDVDVEFHDEGLNDPGGLIQSTTEKAVVTLPEGVTVNPSIGEGLGVCKPDDLEDETLRSDPGEGCPNSSKIGTLDLETPLVDENIQGSVFLAEQDDPRTSTPGAENPFDSLIALYLVLKNPTLGVNVKLPMKVEPDPETGQLVATLDDIPGIPFSKFNFHFREGQRAPLVTPSACGSYETVAEFYPHSDPDNPKTVVSEFEIDEGSGDGPCPPGGVPPFSPHFEAGSINNNAGSYSPFTMRLVRNDGEQNMTKFSSVLPPGVLGSLAGVAKCPDIAVPTAKSKTGRDELALPSCPAGSLIGHTLAGAGVGSALTYVRGQVYLAGPYKGAPLSVIAITPAVAGPFDAGTVVVRLGLDLDPKTAEVSVDGAASDPIPHILKGIVLKLRDLRVYVDRPNFTLNPTSCEESSAKARLFGSFLNVIDPGDDVPVDLATRYQAANCLNLGFNPKLGLKLKGGTRRGGHPGLKAVYTPKQGEANIEDLTVRLPRSAFLDQAHIRTICTRVQYAAQNCPKAAQYGYIRAWTPLLDTPLQGPVWLRSSNNKLPDLVFDLKGLVDIEVSVRIDSARGGIRATLDDAPDAPLSRVVLNMQGGKKGLIINSRNLCTRKSRANLKSMGHNGKQATRNPIMRPQCKRRKKAKRSSHGRASRARVASSSAVG